MSDSDREQAVSLGRPRLRVVYLMGAQHSGSTILETLLQSNEDVFGVGQVGRFWAYTDFPACDCGRPSATCGPCERVVQEVVEPSGKRFRLTMRATRRELGLPLFLLGAGVRSRYAALMDDVYDATAASTGRTVLVDSSKNLSQAIALASSSRHDVRFVHCVRDHQGFIRSRIKRTGAEWPGLNAARLAKWAFKNHVARIVGRFSAAPVLTVRFEDVTNHETIASLCELAGIDPTPINDAIAGEKSVVRKHLFEPPRQLDYSKVSFQRSRLEKAEPASGVLGRLGHLLGRRWGY